MEIKAGGDVEVDQSVEMVGRDKTKGVTVEKGGLLRDIVDDKARLSILAALSCFLSEMTLVGLLVLCKVAVPDKLWDLVYLTLMLSGAVWGAQKINGIKSK